MAKALRESRSNRFSLKHGVINEERYFNGDEDLVRVGLKKINEAYVLPQFHVKGLLLFHH